MIPTKDKKSPINVSKCSTGNNIKPEKLHVDKVNDVRLDPISFFQRQLGNSNIQAKLKVSQPNDKYEQEADRIADLVMQMPEPKVQRQVEEEKEEELVHSKLIAEQITPLVQRQVEQEEKEEELIQTKIVAGKKRGANSNAKVQVSKLKSKGHPLPASERDFFEQRIGVGFGKVRIHKDPQSFKSAHKLNAMAFTFGNDIFFGLGQYDPSSTKGKRLLAHELMHVVQQSRHPSKKIQRRIIVGGNPYTPTASYYSYLVNNFGLHMKEFIKNMHNHGNPPDFTFSSYEQMGFEVRIRNQAVKGIKKVHLGCCNYPDSSNPDYLDSTYWHRVGWMHFKPKSPLPTGKEASDAIEAIFDPGAGTRLECLSMTVAVEYYSLLKGLGKSKFNAIFPGGVGIEISTSRYHLPLLFGAGKKYKIITVSVANEILPGDWVYFKNFTDYPIRNPSGLWRGENAIYLGGGKYRGFGVASLTEAGMNAELVSKYNSELSDSKTVADLLSGGGGLQLTPIARPVIATLSP